MDSNIQRAPAAETVKTCVVDQRKSSRPWDSYYINHRVDEIRKFLESKGVGLDDACTDAAGHSCWLCWNTTPWNKLLAPLSLELVMSGPGELCLRCINVDNEDLKDDDNCHDSAFIFAWLPKQHRCVQSICLDRNILSQMPAYSLKLALGSSVNLRHLKLVGIYWVTLNELELFEELESLTKLESFEFLVLNITPVLASSIAALLRRNKGHLVRVGFKYNGMSQRSTATILSALIRCKALTELSFDDNVLVNRNVNAMARVVRAAGLLKKLSLRKSLVDEEQYGPIAAALKDHTSLEELRLKACPPPLDPVFEALETSTTLRHLELEGCLVHDSYITRVANLLRCNKALRRVVMRWCHLRDVEAERLADAIAENGTLETLDLRENDVSISGIAAFCAALQKNKTLQTVSFGRVQHRNFRGDLARLLSQPECCRRIVVAWEYTDLPPLTAALAHPSQSPSELSLSSTNYFPEQLFCELFSTLAGNTKVKRLKIEAMHGYDTEADQVCRALTANRSIKSLEVHAKYEGPEGLLTGIAKALVHNKTVTELAIHKCGELSLPSSKAFSSTLMQNKTLTTIAIHCGELGTKQLAMLSQGMIQNRTVTSFSINLPFHEALPRNRASFRLHEAVRRNIALHHMAAQFVLQAEVTKHFALAFEMLGRASSLVSHVAKVSGKSEQEAVAAMDAADRYIRSRFLFVSGVVRDAVRCYPGTGTQADALNDHCWQAIAEYLKVSDVRDA